MFSGSQAAENVGMMVQRHHIFVKLPLPGLIISVTPDNAQMDVAVACMPKTDELHTALLFLLADEPDKGVYLADWNNQVYRFLFRYGFHRFYKRASHFPYPRGFLRIIQDNECHRTVFQRKLSRLFDM